MSASERNPTPTGLARLQSWMQAVVTHPGGVKQGVVSAAAQQSMNANLQNMEEIIAPSSTLSGAQRLAIYCRSYHTRLLQCFQAMFPALRQTLGADLFDHFALDYLQHYPPRSYTLDRLADNFPQHLAASRPDADASPNERESWPDFIIDLATLEGALLKIYDGPGVEGLSLPRPRDVLALSDEDLRAARPAPVPCLRLFSFRYPARAYLLAARREESPALPAQGESFVALTRLNYCVALHELTRQQHDLLRLLDSQRRIAQAIELCAQDGDGQTLTLNTVREWLCDWAGQGFFTDFEAERRPTGDQRMKAAQSSYVVS